MKAARVVSMVCVPVLLVVAILAVSAYADKPPSPPGLSKPEPVIVQIAGAIEGTGAFTNIAIEFKSIIGTDLAGEEYNANGSFIANPDFPPALRMSGTPKNKHLSYLYCDYVPGPGEEHTVDEDGICADPTHSSDHYRQLHIRGGVLDKNTGDVVFPVGSEWTIGFKETGVTGAQGTLTEQVTYTVVEWSS